MRVQTAVPAINFHQKLQNVPKLVRLQDSGRASALRESDPPADA